MDNLQLLSSMKFTLEFLKHSKITLTKTADQTRSSSLKFDHPKSSEMLEASKPLWLFSLIDESLEQIDFELGQWAKCVLSHLLFPGDDVIVLRLGDFRFRNAQIDFQQTAVRLSENENLSLDDRLIVAVLYGRFEAGKRVCETAERIGAKFERETAVAMYRRLALRQISAADVMSTVSARIQFPVGFMLHIPLENFQSFNFVDVLRRLIVEFLYDSCLEAKSLLKSVLSVSSANNRSVEEILFTLLKSILPNFISDRRRCDTLLALSGDLYGDGGPLTDHWPTAVGFTQYKGLYLAVVRHPVLVEKLIGMLEAEDFQLTWYSWVTIFKQNDGVAHRIMQIMLAAKVLDLLRQQDCELFYQLCDVNARRSVRYLRDALDKKDFYQLIESRDYAPLMAACKRGHFLIVKLLTDNMNADQWSKAFGCQNYEAFYLASKNGYLAIVQWFSMLCSKFGLLSEYKEAHMITLHMAEIEEKMLQTAVDAMKSAMSNRSA